MNLFSLLSLIGGLAFFLYGMHIMSAGLERLAGGSLEKLLEKMTDRPWKGLLLGAGVTAVIQSSSAVTVMLVGLVNSGMMALHQSVGVIMGSNIGTTVTAWLLSLTGIRSENPAVQLLKPENFSLLLAALGVVFIMLPPKKKRRDVGEILLGFSVLMYGMKMMSGAVSPLASSPTFAGILTAFQNPVLGVAAGALFTAVIQSSSASVGVLQALATTGAVSYGVAIPIIMGQNIGTCVTALLSCIGTEKNAKRVAVVHLSFNLMGTAVFLTAFYLLQALLDFSFVRQSIAPVGVAEIHTAFNLLTTALLFPFSRQLEKLACLLVKDGKEEAAARQEKVALDPRLLAAPAFAVSKCTEQTEEMAELAQNMVFGAIRLLDSYSEQGRQFILRSEERVDQYEDVLGTTLVKLSGKELSLADSRRVSLLLHSIGDVERIGDHAVNLSETARELQEKNLSFSHAAQAELAVLTEALQEILRRTLRVFIGDSAEQAESIEPLEQVIDALVQEVKSRHIRRLQNGSCTIELGFILSDLLGNFERISDHCSNIAAAVIEIRQDSFDTHRYLGGVKGGGDPAFDRSFEQYRRRYVLPGENAVWKKADLT